MKRIISDKKQRAIEVCKAYVNQNKTIKEIASLFGITTRTVTNDIHECALYDYDLYKKAKAKIDQNSKKFKIKFDEFDTSFWDKLDNKTMLRSQVIDYYLQNGGSHVAITVKQVLDQAIAHGIKIVRSM